MESVGLSPPQARNEGLLTRELPDGMMVYDKKRQQAHSLNQTAALVWRHCDGKTTIPEMAALLYQELSVPANEELVWLALERLDKAQLLEERLTRPGKAGKATRRAVIRKLGLAGGLAALLPLVDSLNAPPALAQASGDTTGCTTMCQPCGPASNPTTKLCCQAEGVSGTLVCTSSNARTCDACA